MGSENSVGIDIDLAIKTALKSIDDLNAKFDSFAASAGDNGKKAEGAFATFKGALAALEIEKVIEIAEEAAKKLYEVFIVQGVEAASKQEEAVNAMNVALANSGKFSVEASDNMQVFAESLEHTTKFSSEQILQNGALLESMTKLSGDGLQQATKAAMDLASTYQIDLETATRMIGKAAEGNVTSFHKLGISIQKGSTDAETLANVMKALASEQGAAELKAKDFAGSADILGHSFEEIQKQTGALITKNPAVITGMNMLSQAFQEIAAVVNQNKATLQGFVTQGIFMLLDGIVELLEILDGASRFFQSVWHAIELVVDIAIASVLNDLNNLVQALNFVTSHLPGLKNTFTETAGAMKEAFHGAVADVNKDLGNIGQDYSRTGVLDKVATDVQKFTDKYKKAVETQKKSDDDQTANFKKQSALRAAQAQIEADQKAGFEFQSLFQIEAFEKLTAEQKIQREQSTLTTISGLMKSKNLELFRIGQAAAVANATISGIQAVVQALSAAPPPYSFVLAALVGAAVAVQIADIVSTPAPSFAAGGIVPGTNYSGDNVRANVNSGEMILTMSDQMNLMNSIRQGQGGGSGGGAVHIHGNVYADDDHQVQKLIRRIRDQVEFGNSSLTPVIA